MLFFVTTVLLWITTIVAVEDCIIPSILNGAAEKHILNSRPMAFKKVDEGTKVNEGDEVYLRCSKGYEVSGSSQNETKISCSQGGWSQEFHCTPASCLIDDKPWHYGSAVEEVEIKNEHGGSITYECKPDHILHRDGNVTCEYGEWKGRPPRCKATKCHTDSIQNLSPGVVKVPNQFFYENETYNYTCDSPLYRKPEDQSDVALCKDGMWHVVLPLCSERRCNYSPPTPEHGSAWDFSTRNGSVVNYTCEDPYVLVGDSIVQCIVEEWVGEPPECRDSRCYLKDLGNMVAVIISPDSQITLSGEELNITCEKNYSLSGELPVCEYGVWNRQSHEPICKRSTCYIEDLGNLANISPDTKARTLSGNKLEIKCKEGYYVNGELPTCENGVWSTYLYESLCVEITCEVPNVLYGKLKEFVSQEYQYDSWLFKYPINGYFRMIAPGNTVPSDTALYLCCNNGYSFRGSGTQRVETHCFRGRWTPHPVCQRSIQYRKGIYRVQPRVSKPWDVFE